MLKIEDFRKFIDESAISRIHERARNLAGKKILMVNSTNRGGGVAEILNSLVPLLNSLGVHVEWKVITGEPKFFNVTKKLHNALQGQAEKFSEEEKQIYLETNKTFAMSCDFSPYDLVVIHDPQPLPLIKFMNPSRPRIFQLHIDITSPDQEAWELASPFMSKYHQMVLSSDDFLKKDLGVPQRVFPPAIDPLSEKNRELSPAATLASLVKAGISVKKPIIAQVSRFDRWKDPLGVVKIFELVRARIDCELVLLGDFASDDPEGQTVYDELAAAADKSHFRHDIKILLVQDAVLTNALQKAARVIIQKSIREGFGLTVTEALFKQTPVVGSNTGGIKLQILDGRNGYLNDPLDHAGVARSIVKILRDENLRSELGRIGRRHVIENFLMPRLVLNWLELFAEHLNK